MIADHLVHAGTDEAAQRAALAEIIAAEPVLMAVLAAIAKSGVADGWLVSGAIYNTVWNVLTGRPALHGVNDMDIAYVDPDLSWEAEDRVIKRLEAILCDVPVPIQPRNQARVHLWYARKFGHVVPPIGSTQESLTRYASKTHAVAARLGAGGAIEIMAPFGLDELFSFRVTPNPVTDNRATHETKGARIAALWPEVTVVPWP